MQIRSRLGVLSCAALTAIAAACTSSSTSPNRLATGDVSSTQGSTRDATTQSVQITAVWDNCVLTSTTIGDSSAVVPVCTNEPLTSQSITVYHYNSKTVPDSAGVAIADPTTQTSLGTFTTDQNGQFTLTSVTPGFISFNTNTGSYAVTTNTTSMEITFPHP